MARVLFVDDDHLTLQTMQKAVEIFGHEALLANSGKEALQKAEECLPDLIFTDLSLPDMDGLEIIQALRKQALTAGIPILVYSASQEIEFGEQAIAAGAQGFVTKPIRLNELRSLINQYTGQQIS